MPVKTRAAIRKKYRTGIEKLEIGSGEQPEPGYVHLDIQPSPDLHILADVRRTPLPDNFVKKEIRAAHIMEHFCHPEYSSPAMRKEWGDTMEVILEMYRILKPGGKFRIVTPDYDRICASRTRRHVNPYWLQRWTVGGHMNNFDVHHWLWTRNDAEKWLGEAGFVNIRDWNPVSSPLEKFVYSWLGAPPEQSWFWHRLEWYHWLFIEGTKPHA